MQDFYDVIIGELDKRIEKFVDSISAVEKELVVWGTNGNGKSVFDYLIRQNNDVCISFFGDNDSKKWGKDIQGVEIKGIDFFMKEPENYYVIICSFWENEIANQLQDINVEYTRDSWPIIYREMLISHYKNYDKTHNYVLDIENIWNVFHKAQNLYLRSDIQSKLDQVKGLLWDDHMREMYQQRIDFLTNGDLTLITDNFSTNLEYFSSCYYNKKHITDNEILVDCGAYTGDTIEMFIDAMQGKYNKIYAYEPDRNNYDIAKKYIETNNLPVILQMKGVAEQTKEDTFSVVALDDNINGEVTWIKMDIEGFELAAIQGAKNIIQKYHPKLTICLYHKVEDIYEIPLYLHQLVPEYRFKLSQHYRGHYDFVLYADTYEDAD